MFWGVKVEMAIPNSIARNAGGIRQRFVRFSSTRQTAMIQSRRYWTRAAALAIIANLALFTPTAQAQSAASNDATLTELSLYTGVTFSSRGTANFSEGMAKGFESLGKAFMNALTPQLGDRLTLIPAFTQGVKSYTVTISYDVTSFALIASGSHPGTTIEVTGIGADGAPLKTKSSINDLNITLKETEVRADVLRSFKQVPLGKNTITVAVTSEDGSTTQTTTVAIVRLDPDMDDEKERDLFLLDSIKNEDTDGVMRTIKAGVDVNAWHDLGGKRKYVNPLRLAMGKENAALVQLLIQAGADVNDVHPEGDGVPPLLLASQRGAEQIVRLLIDAGADVNHTLTDQDLFGKNPLSGASALILAIDQGHTDIARLLLEAGADPNPRISASSSRSDAGASALLLAVAMKNEEIARLLIDAGADLNDRLPDQEFPAHGKTTGGVSVLMIAINKGHEEMVRLLIDAGVDVNYKIPGERLGKNSKTAGLTALRIAKAQGRDKIVGWLREAGATD